MSPVIYHKVQHGEQAFCAEQWDFLILSLCEQREQSSQLSLTPHQRQRSSENCTLLPSQIHHQTCSRTQPGMYSSICIFCSNERVYLKKTVRRKDSCFADPQLCSHF